MSFESNKTCEERIAFSAHELSFSADLRDNVFVDIFIKGIVEPNTGDGCLHPNEESLREFHRILGQVLDHVDKQRGVGNKSITQNEQQ